MTAATELYNLTSCSTSTTSISVEGALFEAVLEDASSMNKILHELHHQGDHSVLVITKDGLNLITNHEKTFQISAFFAAATFQKFHFNPDRYTYINFRFILDEFIECLNLLRDDPTDESDSGDCITSLQICYKRRGDPLRLRLENNSNCSINCDLRGFNMPDSSIFCPMEFQEDEETAVILFDSRKLYEYVSGLDLNTSDFVNLFMDRNEIPVALSTKSTAMGEVKLEIAKNDIDVIKCPIRISDNMIFHNNYRTGFMKPALEALKTSSHMKMTCGASGLLCTQHFHTKQDYNQGPSSDYMIETNPAHRTRSSVKYFILAEAKTLE